MDSTKLCKCIDNIWLGIVKCPFLSVHYRVMSLDWSHNLFLLSILKLNKWILTEFRILIDIDKFSIVTHKGEFITELWPLINIIILFLLNIFIRNG